MKSKIEIVHVVRVAGVSHRTGNDYDIRNAQCVVRDADPATGEVKPKIGVLQLPDRYKDLPKGVYMVEFGAAVGQKGGIVSEVVDVKQWDGSEPKVPPRRVLVEVLSVTPRSGFSKKNLKDYDMLFADCIVHKVDRDTGEVSLLVGEMVVPQTFKDLVPGMYEVEFEVYVKQDKKIGGRVVDMKPHTSSVATGAPVLPVVSNRDSGKAGGEKSAKEPV